MSVKSELGPSVIGYAEDCLTLWAIENRLSCILDQFKDESAPRDCEAFYRPGFGRKGGDNSAQFGEFDFIILSPSRLYLGESKWDRSSESRQGVLTLRSEQKIRHELFQRYLTDWFAFHRSGNLGEDSSWNDFIKRTQGEYIVQGLRKRIPPSRRQVARSLHLVLSKIWQYYDGEMPDVVNLLLYFHDSGENTLPENRTGFEFAPISYDGTQSGYVKL